MNIIFPIYGFIILFIFNALTYKFCTKLKLTKYRQDKMFRFTNIIVLILLVTSYVKVLNAMI
ncbi:hypothetical protein FHP05_09855 [Cerasibacillus terrae]|uniref:Uncharacterized protein n=1 Tax=Cerasibacillus terrae TaxID=2498845 RepID=A0A5C8NS77_9BACI|nr:hypothetical protein [Cerasibacillus terrae]TXL63986.1 hypothetical protein FHP05_09855 [Cerasibacillus terrae]